MKKLIMLGTLCVALLIASRPSAYADEKICGYATIDWIQLWESDSINDVPVHPCLAEITITTNAGQTYVVPTKAFGTQLNLALLKAHNFDDYVSICLRVTLYPFKAEIVYIDFGTRTILPEENNAH